MVYMTWREIPGNGVKIWYSSDQKDRVLRGGARSNNTHNLRLSDRYHNLAHARSHDIGFRCVADVE